MAGELYDLYGMGFEPSSEEKRAALVNALRQKSAGQQQTADMAGAFGNLGLLTGDKVLGNFGQAQLQNSASLRALGQKQEGDLAEVGAMGAKSRLEKAMEAQRAASARSLEGFRQTGEMARLDKELGARNALAEQKAKADKADGVAKSETELRKELMGNQVTKDILQTLGSFKQVTDAPETGEADISMVYGMAKLLDPSGRVTDSDAEMQGKQGSLDSRLQGYYNTIAQGGTLNPQARKAMKSEAKRLMELRAKAYAPVQESFRGLATQAGADPSRVVIPLGIEEPAAGPSGNFDLSGPTKIKTDQEWEALPPGTKFIGPDGKPRTK